MFDFEGLNPWQLFKIYVQGGAFGPRAAYEAAYYEKAANLGIPKRKIQNVFRGEKYEEAWKRAEEAAPIPLIVNQPSPSLDILSFTDLLTPSNIGKTVLIGAIAIGGLYIAGQYLGRRR